MQLKTLLPSLLLIAPAFAAPEDVKAAPLGYAKASSVGITKRNPLSLLMVPHYIATPLGTGSFGKRDAECGATANKCYDGCCELKTVCGIYGGEVGCCPEGKTCSGVGGCSKDQVTCLEGCCPSGSFCTKDSIGNPACGTGDDSNTGGNDDSNTGGNDDSNTGGDDDNTGGDDDGCPSGYDACTIFKGCCPTGAQCVLPSHCNIPCSSSDPRCGDGCCVNGSVCVNNQCVIDNGDTFTELVPSGTTKFIGTTTVTTRFIDIETETTEPTEEPTTTDDTDDESSPETTSTPDAFGNNDDATTTESSTQTSVTRVRISTTTTLPIKDNAAPTMGSLIGNGLGVAAGLIGALVL